MAQGDWASAIRLGIPGSELDISGEGFRLTPGFGMDWASKEAVNQNVVGETFSRKMRRYQFGMRVNMAHLNNEVMTALQSIQNVDDTHLAFLYADKWKLNSERYVLPDGGISLTMDSNSFLRLDRAYNDLAATATMLIDGVYSTSSHLGAQTTATSIYASFNRATWGITLNVGQSSGASVYVNSLVNGALVRIKRMSIRSAGSYENESRRNWNVAMQLEGV